MFSQNKTIEINWGTAEKSNQGAFSTENKASKSNRKSATQLLDLLIDQEMLFVEQWQDIRLAEEKLGWEPKIGFDDLVKEMVQSDLEDAKKDELCQRAGFQVFNYNE